MALTIVQIDAFTNKPFGGNPAAVCLLSEPASESWMQAVAKEMNLSETAFLVAHEDGYYLRWFTPSVEVDLCGHATLASAHYLREAGHLLFDDDAQFHTASGLLTVEREADTMVMNFPATPPVLSDPPTELLEVINADVNYVGRSSFDYLVEVPSENDVRNLDAHDFALLTQFDSRGVIVTASSADESFDFVSRFLAPGAGIVEDPVTGSAHCALGPYWAEKLGKSDLLAFQVSARGGQIGVRVKGDRVLLIGQAVTVMQGELLAPLERP
jgi:PhzF family phenazine biosynthesis protein